MTTQDDISQVQSDRRGSNTFENKNSTLSRKNDGEVKSNCSTDNINLSIAFEENKSITDVPNAKLQTCQLSSSESRLSYDDKFLRNSLSHCTSASLPAISSLDSYLVRNKANTFEKNVHTQEDIVTAYTDEEETLFNRLSGMTNPLSDSQCSMNKKIVKAYQNEPIKYEHEKNYLKERITESDISEMKQLSEETISSRLQINKNKTTNERVEVDVCKKNKSNSIPALNINARGSISRPTLADDSKLVKMSLLTNPMNIMQSNVHLLNKSRNFLNFITEKSTNIMEKALLPQHLTMKYNQISKSIETDAAGFCTNNVSYSTDVTSRLDTDSATNRNNTNCTIKQNHDESEDNLDSVINNEKEVNPPACIKTDYDSGGQSLYNNLENEVVSDEKKYVLKNNDFDRLDCDVIDEQVKHVSLTETGENKSFLYTEKLHNDTYKEDTSSGINSLTGSNILKYGSLEHPLYLALLEDYTNLKLKHSKLLDRMEYLEKSNRSNNSFQESQTNADALILQVESLEKTVNKLTADLNTSLDMQEALKKECIAVNKEKEDMIMKYVTSEKQLIDTQRYL